MVALPLIVEFTGLPGAGKTTIARELQRLFPVSTTTSSLEDRRLDGRIWGGHHVLLPRRRSELKAALHAARLAFAARPLTLERLKFAALIAGAPRRLFRALASSNPHVVILDQWILQFVWSICAFSRQHNHGAARRVAQFACGEPQRVVVFVDVENELAVRRIKSRTSAGSRFDRISDAQAEYWMRHSQSVFDPILTGVAAAGSRVIRISGHASAEEIARQIYIQITTAKGGDACNSDDRAIESISLSEDQS